ncbi:MAG: phosphoribosylglycinamide formyltransferase [Bdellovibrionales bacterium]|jgi:phosphoribosylglycinamide formyltransferase 1|nr:phosphoribosylglycinamide formyltransferase [Bdellovibrionales bacterium]MBT3524741.1 phosphoribosylglycinamide formyltransferase [Bdellovibrionales bacterium]MBT7670066.1 phosphoribosylglycinamide formyltransferase [Bdellovibrionales bacterium]MBT7766681.1 phosphoribosylglycinamide formyltransferase [Bdellovibrionales bacterium]
MIKVAIMASGNGSNAENIIRVALQYPTQLKVVVVISDRPQAFVHTRAQELGVPSYTVERLKDRLQHEEEILALLSKLQVEWLCLAGYMRILSGTFLQHFYDLKLQAFRVANIHPSLLPAFPGLNGYQQAFKAQVAQAGVTLHLVDQGVDTGPILRQLSFDRAPDDDLTSFQQRGMELEYQAYQEFINALAHHLIKRDGERLYLLEE